MASWNRECVIVHTDDPFEEWNKIKHKYPILACVACSILCIPATSVTCERVFSAAGQIVTKKRSKLSPEHVNQLLFLHQNMQIDD